MELTPPQQTNHLSVNTERTLVTDLFGSPKKRSSGINSKQKGNKNERVACKWLEEWTGEKFTRVPSSGGMRWKNHSSVCGDVVCENEDFKFCFSVETKFLKDFEIVEHLRENSKIFTIWDQAIYDAARGHKFPMLMLRKNGMAAKEFYIFISKEVAEIAVEIPYQYSGKKGRFHLYGYDCSIFKKAAYTKICEQLKNSYLWATL